MQSVQVSAVRHSGAESKSVEFQMEETKWHIHLSMGCVSIGWFSNLYMEICCLTNSIHLKVVVWSCKIWIVWLPHVKVGFFGGWKSMLPTTFLWGKFWKSHPLKNPDPSYGGPPNPHSDTPMSGPQIRCQLECPDLWRILRVQRGENHTKQFTLW